MVRKPSCAFLLLLETSNAGETGIAVLLRERQITRWIDERLLQ